MANKLKKLSNSGVEEVTDTATAEAPIDTEDTATDEAVTYDQTEGTSEDSTEQVITEDPEMDETDIDIDGNPDTKPPEGNVVIDPEALSTSKTAVKTVRICTCVKHDCCIGGTQYHFEKGKATNVPEEVKEILRKSNLLAPL